MSDLRFKDLAVASQRAEQQFIARGAVVEIESGQRYRLADIGPEGAEWIPIGADGLDDPLLRLFEAPTDPNRVRPAPRSLQPARAATLPTDSAARKELPIAEGVLFYFPAALAEVARISKIGNDKHNPGQPLHHARGKSTDHEDCIVRHTLDARESSGTVRTEHLANRAWRALAALQEHCEAQGAPLAPNARLPEDSEC